MDNDGQKQGTEDPQNDPESSEDPEGTEPEGSDPEGSEDLRDAGKKALDAMKDKWRRERDTRKELERQLAERDKPQQDAEKPDVDAIRREAQQEAEQKALQRVLKADVKAVAAGKLSDPADALKFLDLTEFEADNDGNFSEAEIASAIDDLLKAKPYLSAQGGKRFQGSADGGAKKNSGPKQLSRADLQGMSADAIMEAKAKGQLDDLLGIKR